VVTFVEPTFFAVLDVAPVSGRLFEAGDVSPDPKVEPTAVLVNMKFLERRGMDPQRAIGVRIRFTDGRSSESGAWKEIVGVVPNVEPSIDRVFADGTPVVFIPATPGTFNPMTLTIDLGKQPVAFAPRLRSLVAGVEPAAFLEDVYALDQLPVEVNVFRIAMSVMTGLSLLAIVLSTTALYALMSMTVALRKREIGIRLVLGGSARAVMTAVARRALVQIAAGVALGAGFWVVVLSVVSANSSGGEVEQALAGSPFILAAAAGLVIAIGLAASLGPMVRYMRMSPVDTLRVDA
jgi:hypothetical protein